MCRFFVSYNKILPLALKKIIVLNFMVISTWLLLVDLYRDANFYGMRNCASQMCCVFSFGAGLLGSLAYVRMLGNTVDSMADGAKGLIK